MYALYNMYQDEYLCIIETADLDVEGEYLGGDIELHSQSSAKDTYSCFRLFCSFDKKYLETIVDIAKRMYKTSENSYGKYVSEYEIKAEGFLDYEAVELVAKV